MSKIIFMKHLIALRGKFIFDISRLRYLIKFSLNIARNYAKFGP